MKIQSKNSLQLIALLPPSHTPSGKVPTLNISLMLPFQDKTCPNKTSAQKINAFDNLLVCVTFVNVPHCRDKGFILLCQSICLQPSAFRDLNKSISKETSVWCQNHLVCNGSE